MALFDAGAFARADALLMPQRPETAASRKGDPVEAEHRSKLRDAAVAAVAAVERDVADLGGTLRDAFEVCGFFVRVAERACS